VIDGALAVVFGEQAAPVVGLYTSPEAQPATFDTAGQAAPVVGLNAAPATQPLFVGAMVVGRTVIAIELLDM
jgi:hypothetical protein